MSNRLSASAGSNHRNTATLVDIRTSPGLSHRSHASLPAVPSAKRVWGRGQAHDASLLDAHGEPTKHSKHRQRGVFMLKCIAGGFVALLVVLGLLQPDRRGLEQEWHLSRSACELSDPWHEPGYVHVNASTPLASHWKPVSRSMCPARQDHLADLLDTTLRVGDRELKHMAGKTILFLGDELDRLGVNNFCKLLMQDGLTRARDLRTKASAEGPAAVVGRICEATRTNFRLAFFDLDGLGKDSSDYASDDSLGGFDRRLKEVILPVVRKELPHGKVDLVVVSPGARDLATFGQQDESRQVSLNTPLSADRVDRMARNVNLIVQSLRRRFPKTPLALRSLPRPASVPRGSTHPSRFLQDIRVHQLRGISRTIAERHGLAYFDFSRAYNACPRAKEETDELLQPGGILYAQGLLHHLVAEQKHIDAARRANSPLRKLSAHELSMRLAQLESRGHYLLSDNLAVFSAQRFMQICLLDGSNTTSSTRTNSNGLGFTIHRHVVQSPAPQLKHKGSVDERPYLAELAELCNAIDQDEEQQAARETAAAAQQRAAAVKKAASLSQPETRAASPSSSGSSETYSEGSSSAAPFGQTWVSAEDAPLKRVTKKEPAKLRQLSLMDVWVVDVPAQYTVAVFEFVRRYDLQTLDASHLKRVKRCPDASQSSVLLKTTVENEQESVHLARMLGSDPALAPIMPLKPYVKAVPAMQAESSEQLADWGEIWPISYIPMHAGPKARSLPRRWTEAQIAWCYKGMERVAEVAEEAKRKGELPIACMVADSYDLSLDPALQTTPLELASQHDTRTTTGNTLCHAFRNLIAAVADIDKRGARQATRTPPTSRGATLPYLLTGMTLFTSHEPCLLCSMALLHSRVQTIIYAIPSEGAGGCGTVYDVHEDEGLNHKFEVWQLNDVRELSEVEVDP